MPFFAPDPPDDTEQPQTSKGFFAPDPPDEELSGEDVAGRLKHDQDFTPTPEEIARGYKARMSLPDPGAIWKGAKTLATETLPAQMSKSWQQISAEGMPQPWDLAKSARQATVSGATLVETALRGTAYLGDMLKTPVDAAIGEAAAEAQSPGNAMLRAAQMALGTFSGLPIPVSQRTPEQQSAAEQIWASRMRVAGKDERAMAPYHEGDKTFVPGALGAPAEFASNFVDPTMAVPALKAAGLLKLAGKGAEAASMAGRLSNVAKEAANTGGVVKKAAEVAAPAIEKGAQLAGEGLDKVATGLDKVQPVLDVGGLVKGGLPGAAGAHVVGRGVRAGVKWASKVRDASTGVRNIAKADWNSTWTVAQQLAKDSDAPVWLRRAASSSVAPMVESTIRGAGAVGEGALHGAAIGGAASMANDTLTPEERGEFIGGGAVLGGGGAALGKGIGAVTGRNAQARQAHDWAVMAHEAIQSGADPSTVLGASDATMSYAHSLKQLFKGAMPGGKDLTVRLMDGSQFAEAHPNEPTAVGSFVSSPDGTHEVRLNLDRPDADSRALHEGLGHALMESVVGNTPDAFERARAVFSPDEINTAAQQYATALHPELKGPDQQTWIAQQQANSTLRWGDRDAWILSELISEGAVQEAGGRSIRDMATPGFGSSLQRMLGRDKPFKVETASFFSGDVAAKLKSPELGQLVRGRVEQLGQFRPGIDEPKGNSVVVQKGDWGKKPFAPLHDLAKAPAQPPPLPRDPSQPPPLNPQPPTPAPQVPKGNDFVVVNPTTGAVVARPPAQTRKLVKNRQAAVDKAVPRDGTPASPGDVDPQVKFRTSPSGLVERSGTVLGKWFYDGNVFSETTKGYARKIEDAIKNGTALSGFYHEIGESARGWARSVGERYGNLTAEYKDFIPVGFLVSTAGNLLVRNYSLTAFERKAQTWGARKGALSLELWNGDVGTFKADVQTYLKNHSEGRPGADGIGEQKRNVINAFLVGGNRSFEATNPLRPFAKGADREGIIRSYRLDRLETVEPSDITGFSQPKYEQQLRNLSPKTLYRAGDSAEVGVKPFSSWSEDKETAEAYLNNPGFGGKTLRTESVPMGQVLDADTTSRRGMSDLAEKLGFSRSAGDEWFDNGWRYPWEESKRVKEALQNSGFDAIRYVDDYPQGAKTVVPLKDAADLSKASEPQFSPAPQTDTPEFKKWFGKSVFVNADGKPLRFFHGSEKAGFSEFSNRREGGRAVPATFLTTSERLAKTYSGTRRGVEFDEHDRSPGNYQLYVAADDVLTIDWQGRNWQDGPEEKVWNAYDKDGDIVETAYSEEEAAKLRKSGYEVKEETQKIFETTEDAARGGKDMDVQAVWIKNVEDPGPYSQGGETGDVVIVYDPTRIKSSTDNVGTFDAKNPDIRFSPRVPKDEREVILNLTSATGSLPGLDRLTREASGGDTKAEKTLNGITHDALQLLMSGVAGARVDIQDTRGVFGSSFEPAVQAVVRGTPESINAALAAAERFAKNFNQQEIHRREAAPEGSYFGRTHEDGSFDTPVFAFTLKNELSPGDITRLIEASGLDAITQRGNTLEVYYAGDPTDSKRLLQFERSITTLQNALGDGLQSYRTEAARLWRYGDGQNGTISYERIRGDVRPEPTQQNAIAKRIAERLRGKEVPGAPQAKEITPEQTNLQTRIAKEFEAAPMNELDNPVVAKAYRELADELATQYEHLPVKIEVLTGQGEPYKSSAEMRKDVAENNHLFIFGTTPDSFGTAGVDYKGHPLLEDSGFKDINGKPLLKNDLLRAVHDYYAHTLTPVEFGPKGEEAAWKNHMQMTKSPWARLALTTETRGQNSAVNFGKNAEFNKANKKDTIFADQKVTVLDPEFSKIGDPEADAQIDAIADEVRGRSQAQFSPSTDEAVQKMKTSALNLFYQDSADIPPATPKTKRTLDEVAPLLKKAAEDQWGRTITSSDITPDELQTIVNNGVEETKAALKASGKNAFDWYTHAIARAVEVMKVIHPEMKDDTAAKAANFPSAKAAELGMTLAMAITSQNLNVRMNTRFANEQFEALKRTGRFDASKEYGGKALSISSNLDLANALLDLRGWDGLREFVHKEFTVGELSKTISDTLGKKVTIAGRTADKVNGSAIFGPKIGQGFFQNLSGNFTPVTVDLWMRRTWGRWTGDVMEADPLTPARIARLLDAARTEKVATPAEVKTVRTVLRDSQPTFSDTTAEKLRSDPALRDVLTKWSYDLFTEWQYRRYKDIKMPVRPTDAEALRAGSLSLDQLAKKQRTVLDALDRRFAGLKDKPKKSDWVKAQLTRMGHTETLDNKTISATRPEWAKAAKVVADAFGPIDAPTDQDRATITQVIMGIKEHLEAEGVKVTPADLQAILWYPEKDIWSKLMDGSGESDLKLSYDDEFLSLADAAGLGKEARSAIAECEKARASRGGEPDDTGTAPDVRPSSNGSAPK